MAATCPIKSHPSYVYAVDKLNQDKALEIFDAVGSTPKNIVDATVKQRDAAEPILVPNNSKRKAYVGGRDNNGLPFDNFNNDRSWEVENKAGLVKGFTTAKDGRKIPNRQYFGLQQAVVKIPKLMEQFPGFVFAPRDVMVDGRPKVRIVVNDLTFPVWAKDKPVVQELKRDVTDEPKMFYHELYKEIEVLKKAIPWEVKVTLSTEIEGIAQLEPGGREILINPLLMTKDAIGHEFGHIFIDILGGMSNPLVKQGREQLRGTKLEADVIAKYPEIANDIRVEKEIVTTALGIEVAKIFEDEARQTRFMRWLIRFFRSIRAKLGLEQSAVRKLAERLVAQRELQGKEKATTEDKADNFFIAGEASEYTQKLKKVESLMDTLIAKEEEFLNKSKLVVERKISIYQKRDPESREVLELEALKPKLERSSATKGMIQMIRYAANSTNRMNNTYKAYLRDVAKGTDRAEINARLLSQWRTHVSAFDILDDFKALMIETKDKLSVVGNEEDEKAAKRLLYENKDLIASIIGDDQMKKVMANKNANIFDILVPILNDIIEVKEKVKNLYKEKGREIMIDWLAPMAGLVEAQYREKWEEEWRLMDKKPMELDKYLMSKQLEFGETIKEETKNLVAIELEKADADISYWRRYADTILDSPDVISSAIAKVFFNLQEKTRRETIEWKYQFADRIDALEKAFPRPISMSDEEYFDMFLERDPVTGELNDYIVSEIPTQLVADYLLFKSRVYSRHYKRENGTTLKTEVDRWLELKAWKDKYAPRRKEEWLKAQEDKVQDMLDRKIITTEEQKRWARNSKVTTKKAKLEIKDIFENHDAVNEFNGFLSKNNWTYRDVSQKYKDLNTKWKALEAIRKSNPNDERIKFYDFIIEASNEAENNLPISYRLGNKVPSMHKTFGQKLRSEDQTLGKNIKDEIKDRLQLQKYDTNRGELQDGSTTQRGKTELVNEANEPVYFVPVYYVNDIGETTYVLDENAYKKMKEHGVPSEIISKLRTSKKTSFDSEAHMRGYLEHNDPNIEESPLTAEEVSLYMEYIVFDSRKKDLSNKSFDLTSVYYNYLKMSIDFRNKFEIQHEAEMARFFVNNREVIRRDAQGKAVLDALTQKIAGWTGGVRENARVDAGNKSQLAAQLEAFYRDQLYGMSSQEEPDLDILGYRINRAKLLDNISGYTALSLLGVNFVAGFANVTLGEITQSIEAWAGEIFGAADMTKATGMYYKELGGILGDIGERRPTSLIGMLNDQFDTLNEFDEDGNMIQGRWYANMMKTNTLFFTSHAGEHYMQTRAMLAMLNHIRALDAEGNDLGSILDNYSVDKETNMLKFNDHDGKVVNWSKSDMDDFSARMHRALSRMHGEYSAIGKSELQQQALGRMAIMFRRFVIPGFKRRWEKKQYNNLYGDFTEGNYRTFGRFIKNLSKDLAQLKFSLMTEEWKKLSTRDKANILRTMGEISAFLAASALAALVLRAKEDDDKDNWALSMAAYQALRLKSELSFFINPAATLQILRSPMASISFAQSLIELVDRALFYPVTHGFQFEVYQAGSWKEHYKVEKTLTQMFPVYKQYYRLQDIEDQLSWFSK